MQDTTLERLAMLVQPELREPRFCIAEKVCGGVLCKCVEEIVRASLVAFRMQYQFRTDSVGYAVCSEIDAILGRKQQELENG